MKNLKILLFVGICLIGSMLVWTIAMAGDDEDEHKDNDGGHKEKSHSVKIVLDCCTYYNFVHLNI